MLSKLTRYLRYIKLSLLVIRYRIRYRPKRKVKYIFLSWHHDKNMPMYLTMDFSKTESMGDDVWSDQFLPIFDRTANKYNQYLAEHTDVMVNMLDPAKLHTIKQRLFYFIAFGHILRLLSTTEYVIIYDRSIRFARLLAPYLEKKYPNVKIIVQFINTVETGGIATPKDYKDFANCVLYSFDQGDIDRYSMKKFNWYVDDQRLLEYSKINPKHDISFIGEDKKRVPELVRLAKIFNRYGISHDYYVTFNDQLEKDVYKNVRTKNFNYEETSLNTFEYQRRSCESKAVLEILQKGQSGSTLRAAETIFLRRKLITNKQDITEEPYYNKENIFILGKDDIENLDEFLKSPYKILPDKITRRYTYEYMLQQLDKDNA